MIVSKLRQKSSGVAALLLVMLLAGCEPPGKPGSQEEELKAPVDFKTVFAANCSGCHGADGRQGPGRVLNDPLYLTVSTKENIRQTIEHGRAGTLMPAFGFSNGGPLSDKQIDALVDGMQTNWAKPFDSKGAPIPSYDGAGFAGDVTRGKKLFLRGCFACHAKGGVAGPVNDATYLSLSSNQNLRTSIIVGRPDFPGVQMPNYRSLNAGHPLADQDVADLVSYLAALRPPNSAMAMTEMQNVKSKETDKTQAKE